VLIALHQTLNNIVCTRVCKASLLPVIHVHNHGTFDTVSELTGCYTQWYVTIVYEY